MGLTIIMDIIVIIISYEELSSSTLWSSLPVKPKRSEASGVKGAASWLRVLLP